MLKPNNPKNYGFINSPNFPYQDRNKIPFQVMATAFFKYLKWLDITGTSRANIIGLDNSNNLRINSDYGNMYLNSNSVGNNWTFMNVNHTVS